MSETLIDIQSIRKSYLRGNEEIIVLDDISIQIPKGDFLALMGPSGSGKTTLLNLIAGLDTPDSGAIFIGNKNISGMKERELTRWRASNVGFVFQFYNLIPVLSALENVMLPLSLLQMSEKERKERASFVLEVVGLKDRLNHFPRQLSGGQEQRVAIARSIVSDPTIIVADEPTGDLDRKSASEVMSLLGRIHKEFKTTIVMVTHDQNVATSAAHTIHLDKGKLVQQVIV